MNATAKPPLIARIGMAIGHFKRGIAMGSAGFSATSPTGQWEGWERNRLRARPTTRLESMDSSLDLGTREQLTSEARSLCQVFPVARRILLKFDTYTVGDCRYKWNTGNPAVDAAYRDYWYDWMNRADANGRHRFTKLASQAVMGMQRDGDMFASYVPAGPDGRDIQVRLIEGDRIGNYRGGMLNVDDEKERITGGIIHAPNGRPRAYRLNKRGSFGNFIHERDMPAAQVRHLFDPDRVDAVRGVTAFHPVLNHLRDIKETIDAKKSAIKQHSKIAFLVKSVIGGTRSGYGGVTLNENKDTSANSAQVNVQEINEGMTAYIYPEEEMKAFQSQEPEEGWFQFIGVMMEQIAIGFNLPVSVILKMSGTGPAVRHDMADASRTFNAAMDTLEEKFTDPTVAMVISNGIERGLIPEHPNWHKFERQRPPSITIDLGRESKANIDENDHWLRTGADIANEAGGDNDENVVSIANERAKRYAAARDAATEHNVPIEYILNPNPTKAAPEPQEDPEDPEDPQDDMPEDDSQSNEPSKPQSKSRP